MVIQKDKNIGKRIRWVCKCDCGNVISVTSDALKSGHTQSCGCYQKEKASQANRKYNIYIEKISYYKVILSNENYFLIEKDDKNKIEKYCWRQDSNGYIITTINNKNIYLHKFIFDFPDNSLVDHKNHIVFDYRKSNLRIVNQSKNQMNAKLRINNTSGITGVYWSKNRNKWIAQLKINGKNLNLGGYINISEAINARKNAEDKFFGQYSYEKSILEMEE